MRRTPFQKAVRPRARSWVTLMPDFDTPPPRRSASEAAVNGTAGLSMERVEIVKARLNDRPMLSLPRRHGRPRSALESRGVDSAALVASRPEHDETDPKEDEPEGRMEQSTAGRDGQDSEPNGYLRHQGSSRGDGPLLGLRLLGHAATDTPETAESCVEGTLCAS